MSSPEVGELLERRAQVQTWLERLEAQRGTVSDRALERVREDYEGRLRDTLEALRSHREAIEGELAEARRRSVLPGRTLCAVTTAPTSATPPKRCCI